LAITKGITAYWPDTSIPCRLLVSVASPLNAETAMLVNLKEVKVWMQAALGALAGQLNIPPHLNKPTLLPWGQLLNALVAEMLTSLPTHLPQATLLRLRLDAMTGHSVLWQNPQPQPVLPPTPSLRSRPMHVLTRRYEFSAAHRLCSPHYDDDTNWAVFYECNNPNGHGHNYELEVMLAGDPNPATGMLINLLDLDALVQQHLVKPMDHKHLNHDVAFLQGTITTAETVAMACYHQLKPHLPESVMLYGVRLHESRNNAAEYYGQSLTQPEALLPIPH